MKLNARETELLVREEILKLIDESRTTDSKARENELQILIPHLLKALSAHKENDILAIYARKFGCSVKIYYLVVKNSTNQAFKARAAKWLLDRVEACEGTQLNENPSAGTEGFSSSDLTKRDPIVADQVPS